MKKQRTDLPQWLFHAFLLLAAGECILFGFFTSASAVKKNGIAGIFTLLTGDELSQRPSESMPAVSQSQDTEKETAAEKETDKEAEEEEYLIFTPDEGSIPYRTVDYENSSAAESPPEDAEALKAITISSSMTPKNNPSLDFDAAMLVEKEIPFDKETMSILIIHTHGSEAYSAYETAFWCKNMAARSEDASETVVAVGRVLKNALEEDGFRVIHDETMCDLPRYNASYKSALAVIEKHLAADSSIGMVLDIHRDSLAASDGTRYKLLSGDKRSAQLMFVVGSNALLTHDAWQTNLSFALRLQREAMARYEDLVRPISISKNRYNEHMTPCSLIVECGTEANTLTEAKESARRLAEILDAVLSR